MNLSTFIFVISGAAGAGTAPSPPSEHIVFANWYDRVMEGMRQAERTVARHAIAEYLTTGDLPTYSIAGSSLEPSLVPTYGFMPASYQTLHWHALVADLTVETGAVICAHTPAAPSEAESRAFNAALRQLPQGRAWLSDACGAPDTPLTGTQGVTLNFSIPKSLMLSYVRTAARTPDAGETEQPAGAPPATAPGENIPGSSATAPGQAQSGTVIPAGRGRKSEWVIVPKGGRPAR